MKKALIIVFSALVVSACSQKQDIRCTQCIDEPPAEIMEMAELIRGDTAAMLKRGYILIGNGDADWLFKYEQGKPAAKYMYVTYTNPYPAIWVLGSIGFMGMGMGLLFSAKDRLERARLNREMDILRKQKEADMAKAEYMKAAAKFQEQEGGLK